MTSEYTFTSLRNTRAGVNVYLFSKKVIITEKHNMLVCVYLFSKKIKVFIAYIAYCINGQNEGAFQFIAK